MDLRNNLVKFAYGRHGQPSAKEGAAAFLSGAAGKNGTLQKFELWLGMGAQAGQPARAFLVGKHATVRVRVQETGHLGERRQAGQAAG